MSQRSRRWFLTVNNPTEDVDKQFNEIDVEYAAKCTEYAPSTGTKHYHIILVFKNTKSWKQIKDIFETADIEQMKGTVPQALQYLKKNGEFIEKGIEPKGQGFRSDLQAVADALQGGSSIAEVAENYPVQYIKFNKGIEKLFAITQKEREGKPKVYWLWGKTGVGKTKKAVEICGDGYYIKDGTKWWDGYDGRANVIIDDFDGLWPIRDLLRLLDRYKYQGQMKGGYIRVGAKIIVITCDKHPKMFYASFYNGDENAQLMRRLDEIIEITETKIST